MIKLVLFDLDGTLYRGQEPIPFAVPAVQRIRESGRKVRFLTNNSGVTPSFLHQKLVRMGFAAQVTEIYTTAVTATLYCRAQHIEKVFVLGEPGLVRVLEDAGIRVVNAVDGVPADKHTEDPDVVIAGVCRSMTYKWVNAALQCLLKGARFVATNTDNTYPVEDGKIEPGAGMTIAALQACSRKPDIILGKPERPLYDMILKETGCLPHEALMVGDRYETDILGAIQLGVKVLMVRTGVTSECPEGVPIIDNLRTIEDYL